MLTDYGIKDMASLDISTKVLFSQISVHVSRVTGITQCLKCLFYGFYIRVSVVLIDSLFR